jgi:hypothetical protein
VQPELHSEAKLRTMSGTMFLRKYERFARMDYLLRFHCI